MRWRWLRVLALWQPEVLLLKAMPFNVKLSSTLSIQRKARAFFLTNRIYTDVFGG